MCFAFVHSRELSGELIVDSMAWPCLDPHFHYYLLQTLENWIVLDDVIAFCATATSFVPEILSAVSLKAGIHQHYLAHTNWLHTRSEDFLKSESYRKQTDLYLHGSMSEIPKIRATFSEHLSSNLNWTDQSEFLAW